MEPTEWALLALSLGALGYGAYMLISAVRRPADTPAARFSSGWQGAYGLIFVVGGALGLAVTLASAGVNSIAGVLAGIALNAAFQPLALFVCWASLHKIVLGVCGHATYAGQRIPDAELAELSPAKRRLLACFCVFRGMVTLSFGVGFSLVIAYPLLQWLAL
jgi:hypothetical protein